jgi:hypothetical protein
VRVQEQYAGNDVVVFVGMTPDGSESIAASEQWCASHGVPWPSLYGAMDTLTAFGVSALPTTIVIGRDGRIAAGYVGGGSNEVERAIEKALAAEASETAAD